MRIQSSVLVSLVRTLIICVKLYTRLMAVAEMLVDDGLKSSLTQIKLSG